MRVIYVVSTVTFQITLMIYSRKKQLSAGNMTNDGTQAYSYDEANRLLATGLSSYSYSGLESKRLMVYGSFASPSATFNLYSPDGKRLGWYRFGTSNSWTTAIPQGFSNYLYLGNKPLNYADDRIGSNRSDGTYYPFGNPYNNANFSLEDQAFGTYVQDSGSPLLYADQRYFNSGYGRFMTADHSNANVHYGNSTSWNRYAYANGDPANEVDPTGRDSSICYSTSGAYVPSVCVTIQDGQEITLPDDSVGDITNHESVTVTDTPDPTALDYGNLSNNSNNFMNGVNGSGTGPTGSSPVVNRVCQSVTTGIPYQDAIASTFNLQHCWLNVDGVSAGMGPKNSGPLPSNPFGVPVIVTDESGKQGGTSEPQPDEDPDCVKSYLTVGTNLGTWGVMNNCNTFVSDVLSRCATKITFPIDPSGPGRISPMPRTPVFATNR